VRRHTHHRHSRWDIRRNNRTSTHCGTLANSQVLQHLGPGTNQNSVLQNHPSGNVGAGINETAASNL
jgi:hypothetical protein